MPRCVPAPTPMDAPVPNPLPSFSPARTCRSRIREHLFERLVLGRLEPAEIAGMLIALRMKGETAEEMIGAARALSAAALCRSSGRTICSPIAAAPAATVRG